MIRVIVVVLISAAMLPVRAQTTVAGVMPGSFRVAESGAAEYRVPIRVPSGVAGIEPKLALVYNSQAGNGLIGMGWNLQGLSVITRCPRTMAQDGMRLGVNFDANDRFCLDGQRLVSTSAAYGPDGTEYRTERESFTKVVSYGTAGNGPQWFKVWMKSGEIIEYGNTSDSRIEAENWSTVRLWAVNKITDRKGNYLTVSYQEDNNNGDYRPARIDYTGATTPAQAPFASVQFVYESRSDGHPWYHAGRYMRDVMRLSKIRTYVGASLVKSYDLSYTAGDHGRLRLSELKECDAGGACLPAMTFEWQGSNHGLFSYAGTPTPYSAWHSVTPLDLDGDGKSDYLVNTTANWQTWTSNGDGTFTYRGEFSPYTAWHSATPGDFNGDGRSDVMINTTNGGWQVWFSNGDGTFTLAGTPTPYSAWHSPAIGDFDGDGRSDYLINTTDGGWQVWTSNGNGTFTWRGVFSPYSAWHSPRIGDFNGDGLSDVIINTTNGGWQIWFSNGNGTFGYRGTPISDSSWSGMNIVDFNGDGKSDIVIHNGSSWQNYLSKGDGSFEWRGTVAAGSWHSPVTGDFDGDGKTDIVFNSTSSWDILTSIGEGNWTARGPMSPYSAWHSPAAADFNGDGRTDILINTTNGGWQVYFANASAYPPPDVLTSVTNGSTGTTSIAYKPLTNSSVYTKETTATYPTVDLQISLWVVSSYNTPNGIGGTTQTDMRYVGAKSEQNGRGFLGFRQIASTDVQTGIQVTSTLRQDWPYLGMPSLVRKTQSSGAVLSESTSTLSCTNPVTASACTTAAGNRYFPFVSQSVETGNDLNGAGVPSVTTTTQYDTYGNPTSVTASTADGHSKATTNTFINDAVNWLLGRLTRSTVQSTSP
jgi:hypothetical protein